MYRRIDDTTWQHEEIHRPESTANSSVGAAVAITPDGKHMVFSASGYGDLVGRWRHFDLSNDIFFQGGIHHFLGQQPAEQYTYFGKKMAMSADGKFIAVSASKPDLVL